MKEEKVLSSNLKPCPFCGESAYMLSISFGDRWCVECENGYCGGRTGVFFKEHSAINAWNKRTGETNPQP